MTAAMLNNWLPLSNNDMEKKVSTNGFTPPKSQLWTMGHEMGKMNKGFDNEGEMPSRSDNWRGTARVEFSRQP